MTRPEQVLVQEGARKILAEYDDPPEGGNLVPRIWVEEHLDELRAAAEVERQMLGDLSNFRPTGLVQALGSDEADCRGPLCGREIRFVTPFGDPGSEPCDLTPGHEGDCGSSQLLVRPANAQGDVVSDSAYVEANVCTLADVVAQYRELRQSRAKLAAVEALAREVFGAAKHSDYGNGRWDVADRIMRILDTR